MKRILFAFVLMMGLLPVKADNDYKETPEYLALRDSMHRAFNDGDSARFFPAVKNLQDYLLKQNDLHAYYTQRCNEIVFQMNRQRILEAYKLARQLSQELQERKLDKEMYMAYNMLGHLNRFCGNKEAAKRNFKMVIEMMEKAGYYESMPPIYMNLVNIELNDDPAEAQSLLDTAAEIAKKYSPERVFDIETRKTLSYFNGGDIPKFLEGYQKYREGVAEGKSSVHGRSMDIYYEACLGNTEKAIEMANKELGEDSYSAKTKIYEMAGRWKEAFESYREETSANDSIVNVVLINSMQGFRDELRIYDMERKTAKARTITLSIIIVLLLLLVFALAYIMFSRRRHMKQLKRAYEHALESDKMKAAFIQNMSHEVRTPLNVISGFAQVLANPELSGDADRRKDMAQLMLKNTRIITNQIDAMLELSLNEASGAANKDDSVNVNQLMTELIEENKNDVTPGIAFTLETSLDNDFCLQTNKMMLRRMVNALLDNAIKNTSEGHITLKLSADNTDLDIAVEDTGSGIPANEAEHIFERFYKLDAFKSGLGLGLPLCRLIATRLGGSIRFDSDYQEGARFVVTLPVE
jgi:signal transduction histidine kinase